MAGGADGSGAAEAAKAMRERAERMLNQTPVLKVFAAWATKQMDDSFQSSKTFEGEPFQPLAESTIEQRMRDAGAGASKRGKKSQAKRAAMQAPGGIKPLVKTARARNSQRMQARGKNGLEWSAIGYLQPHMEGAKNGRPPQRNPTVFNVKDGELTLKPRAMEKLQKMVAEYIDTGKVTS